MLDAEQAKRRIDAARTLRGLSQIDLDALGADYGLGKQDLSRTERGELPLTRARASALAELLTFPREWFESESIDELIRWPTEDLPASDVRRAAELLAPQLLEAARALSQASGTGQTGQGEQGHP